LQDDDRPPIAAGYDRAGAPRSALEHGEDFLMFGILNDIQLSPERALR
jgi:hypothetical protein